VSHTNAKKKIAIIPSSCPCGDCNIPVPTAPSANLLAILKTHGTLIKEHGEDSKEVLRSSLMVHIELEATYERTQLLNLAHLNQWPTEINFKTLPDRILAMEHKLTELVFLEGTKGTGPVQDALRDIIARFGLGTDFSRFAKLKHTQIPELIIQNARPG
jgi:hypothetical protein